VLLSLVVGLLGLAPAAEATRTMPSAVACALEPRPAAMIEGPEALAGPEKPNDTFAVFNEDDLSLFAALSLLDASEIGRLIYRGQFSSPGCCSPTRFWSLSHHRL